MGTCVALNKKKGGKKAKSTPKNNIKQKKLVQEVFKHAGGAIKKFGQLGND